MHALSMFPQLQKMAPFSLMSFSGQIMTIMKNNMWQRDVTSACWCTLSLSFHFQPVGLHGPQQKGKEQRERAEVPLFLWCGAPPRRQSEGSVSQARKNERAAVTQRRAGGWPGCGGNTETHAAARWDSRPDGCTAQRKVLFALSPTFSFPRGRRLLDGRFA